MGLSKTNLFTGQQNQLAATAKAIGHPARLSILQHLIQVDQCVNGEIVDQLGLAQSTISQHLKELKAVGLIKGTIEGSSTCYCIDSDNWNVAKKKIQSFFDQFPVNNCC